MQDIYLTGAKGFLGSHLVNRLENYTAIPHDQIQSTKLEPFNKFFFLSAYGNMYFHQEDDRIIQANISDLITILDQIDFTKGFKSFVYISTSSTRLKRQTMYSRSKKAAEEILLAYAEKYDVPICIIRPFSITGAGEQKEHLIPTLIRSCLTGEKMNFVPQPIHDYIDVEDVVEGIINLSNHSARGVFELGSGEGVSNLEVLRMVEKATGKKANINTVTQMRDYDNKEWISGNYRSRMYGWLCKVTLEQSIKEMVSHYLENKQVYEERGV